MTSCKNQKKISITKIEDEVKITIPCTGVKYNSEEGFIRATGIGESMDITMAKRMARSNALEELASKINTKVLGLIDDYFISRKQNMNEDLRKSYQGLVSNEIDAQISDYRTICEEYTKTKSKNYKAYYCFEIPIESVTNPLYKRMQDKEQLKIDYDYEKFKEEFKKRLKKE
ncbi:MAG: hypothetical protein B6I24_03305 [Bacteroidetes bacterium 4572_128]|nr:MAG: hypothetical protein B6I24_03305 [Bacteroidetes bacterium 4572_128]